ncbi:MAG: extracellular solute-binding protein [Alicyclobacillus sp.]|nr:extracellular solute-binding protein [Alicyclobacillus sp.]
MKRKSAAVIGIVSSLAFLASEVSVPVASAKAQAAKQPVTITFASWWSTPMIMNAIAEFNATHPGIHVKWDSQVTWDWNQHLAAAAAAKKFPDVFMVFDVPTSVSNGWLADLTPYLKKDKTYNPNNIFGNLTATGNYFGHQYALPLSLYAGGIVINTDLFKQNNVPIPKPNWTLKEFENDAKKLTKVSQHQLGLENAFWTMNANLVAEFNPKLGQFTWDGQKFNFTNPAFAQSINFLTKLVNQDKVDAEGYSQSTLDQWYGKGKDGFDEGKIAMRPDFTWSFPSLAKEKFHWAFLPYPGQNDQRIPLVTDYIGMSKTTAHPQQAFEFLRWLAYSEQGWEYRMTWEDPVSSIPLIKSQTVWHKYLSKKYIPKGMSDVLNMIPNGFVDLYKWLPGVPDVENNIVGPYWSKFLDQTARPEDLAGTFQTKSNEAYHSAVAALKTAIQSQK